MSRRRTGCVASTTRKLVAKGKVKLSASPLEKVYRDIKQVFAMETSRDTTYKAGFIRRNNLRKVELDLDALQASAKAEVNKEYLNIHII